MKENKDLVIAIKAEESLKRTTSIYPEPFASRMKGREKHALGDIFGIKKFGVNLTRLKPGSQSALLHQHSLQEEFVYIIYGNPTLITDKSAMQLKPGMCAGFTPDRPSHYLINKTNTDVLYLEIGDRPKGDAANYPEDDLIADFQKGQWRFLHKDGTSY